MLAAPPTADSEKKEVVPATPLGGPASPPTPSQQQSREPSMDAMTLPACAAETPTLLDHLRPWGLPRGHLGLEPVRRSSYGLLQHCGLLTPEADVAPPVVAAAAAVAPPVPRPPPPRVIEQRNGEVIINVSIVC
ncbi:Hypothetical protein, putative [Bodo saltans]|uniref:Uncharacterized protein n=1 Tax=Bodo saltans TaxID=75058 RepID=A0A0S4IY17_BODSA|nr:Hypothetical protein, putative [Bodo saltans]|eukprot:CUG48976.1 Hypothetical protein, putative [Bodo saltans]